MTRIDIVVAVRDEAATIPRFVADVLALPRRRGVGLGLVFVEDSSRDDTRDVLRRLAADVPEVRFYSIANTYGQGPAIVFGVARSRADAVITMDVDGTHPAAAIPLLVDRFLDGDTLVQCVRRSLPGRPLYRSAGTAGFHLIARIITGVDTRPQNVYFRLMSAGRARELLEQPRYWRLLRFPLPAGGTSFIEVDAVDRQSGGSKYGVLRLAILAIDGILSLLSPTRAVMWAALIVATGWLLWSFEAQAAALAVWALPGVLGARYYRLTSQNPLETMRVLECAGGQPAYLGRCLAS
jgi:dolichol-phosphate mannosyltransferase